MALSISIAFFLSVFLLPTSTAQPTLSSNEQQAVYKLLESINAAFQWRLLFPDDLCSSSPHGIVCELFEEPTGDYSVHITELSFGFVSDYSSNPFCTPNSTINPHHLTPLTHLRKLFFYKCFTGTPVTFPNFSPLNISIQHLVFIDNPSLVGSITGKISNMNLIRFILTGSNVSGEIKSAFGDLDNAEEITLSRNQFTGELPPEIFGNMNKLKILDLSQNGLEGNLPKSTGGLTGLLKLDLSYNRFSGEIPETLKAMKDLEFLDLSYNVFTNSGIPAFFSGMTSLREVYLNGNLLGGHIPEIWENLKGIIGIGLSGNGLIGNIPPSMGLALKKVSYIGLDNNNLEGPIPEEFGALENVYEINLENNRLSGSLPFGAQFVNKMGKKLKLAGNPELCVEKRAINGSLMNLRLCRKKPTTFESPLVSTLLRTSSSAAIQEWPCFLMFFIWSVFLMFLL
ncbi:piriformospora indica-insensitive protein 2 [Impatiens glandulifera]|uniref:piriformospora indica-insensitive protein 2 n=1 Tax=Impatiens glandulifera TaxID=253017 RepID=UPI001FB0AE95|nr:piriformospora indica-insensitive protein 2 [Impatiens glandulifera]